MLVAMVANWLERKEFGVEVQEGILKIPFLLWFCFFGSGLKPPLERDMPGKNCM